MTQMRNVYLKSKYLLSIYIHSIIIVPWYYSVKKPIYVILQYSFYYNVVSCDTYYQSFLEMGSY